ncbi:MAG: L,D-transpeptidase [Myxococcota bacterium]
MPAFALRPFVFAAGSRGARSSRARPGVRAVAALALAVGLALGAAPAFARDPGFAFELDLAEQRLRVRDARTGEEADEIRVAVGSPAHPTPRGSFKLGRVILRPTWTPGAAALANGAEPEDASLGSPMGVAKIPFAEGGSIALHGGGDPDVLGKPVSSGCVRASDADLLRLIVWLHLRGGLGPAIERADGELHRGFARPARLRVE